VGGRPRHAAPYQIQYARRVSTEVQRTGARTSMSVYSQQGAYSAPTPQAGFASTHPPEFPHHIVTAVLVAHDGARWLPDALAGLCGQERPVQSVIAADTGSADDTARLLTESLGAERVVHLARRTGFGTAVAEAIRAAAPVPPEDLPYLQRHSGWDPASRTWNGESEPHGDPEPVQWLWLLHDDCAPAPNALAELLRVADSSPSAAVIGPKLRSWYDRRALLEVGVTIARSGRRWTGLERGEQDQGQHDQIRRVLSVSSAGMLVRRDVWEALGGFDRRLPLMRDDVDFCWRVHAAGHGVLIAPEAVLRHAEAASRERRTVDCAGRTATTPHRVDKAGAVYTLLANTRGALLPYVAGRIVVSTLLRTLAYLVGKVPGQALDEITGLLAVLFRPGRIFGARLRRGHPAVPPSELRHLFPPPGATLRATVEGVYSNLSGRSEPDSSSAGRHGGAVESGPGGDDADYLEIEQFARLRRIAHKPGPMLFAVLLLVSLIACRGLFGSGALAGGALLPAPSDSSDLWGAYAGAWHAVSIGSVQAAPPYLAIVALASSFLFGSTSLALTLLLVCSVPLAGLSSYFASRPLVTSRLLRAWGAVAYAFLPAATGALAGGRLGTAVLAILLPLMARAAVAAGGLQLNDSAVARGVRPSWRATWAFTLLLIVTTAFTPVMWLIAVVLCVAVAVLRIARRQESLLVPHALRSLAVIGTPLLILAPWSLTLLAHPSLFLREAGATYRGGTASPLDLLMLSPGGPKASAGLLLIGIVVAGLAALLRSKRRFAVLTAWTVALTGLLAAAMQNSTVWAGPVTLIYGLALLSAAVIGAEGARERISASGFGWRQPVAAFILLTAGAAPLIAALGWMYDGAAGPLSRRDSEQVPAFVAEESSTQDQARTLVLDGDPEHVEPGHVKYTLVRGSGAQMGDAEIAAEAGNDSRLGSVVANLVAGSGADQISQLSGYAVRYVLVQPGTSASVTNVLDSTPGLDRVSQAGGTKLWSVATDVSRITITSPDGSGTPVAVAAGKVEAHTTIPSGPSGRILRLADSAAPGWRATLDGRPLTPTTLDGWAQGFHLPASGGRLDLTYDTPFTHWLWLSIQGLLALVVVVLALPGRRRDVDDDLPEDRAEVAAAIPAGRQGAVDGEGRRARRLRATVSAAATADEETSTRQLQPDEGGSEVLYSQPGAQQEYGQWGGEYQGEYQNGYYDPYQQGVHQQSTQGAEYGQYSYPEHSEYSEYPEQPYGPAYDHGHYNPDGSERQ
jgi:GT2 family glycosyltransferase